MFGPPIKCLDPKRSKRVIKCPHWVKTDSPAQAHHTITKARRVIHSECSESLACLLCNFHTTKTGCRCCCSLWHCCKAKDIPHQLLNRQKDIYSQSAQVKQVSFQLGTVVHLHAWKEEQFFRVGRNILWFFWNIHSSHERMILTLNFFPCASCGG